MRPLHLHVEGFTSFRDATDIDFSDADYFALIGPTGSGKSTIIDAICFALYGTIPRLDDRRFVAPVITQGHLEARVKLDFSVDGQTYTAARVVRRSAKGATTKEARLERGDDVLAGNADELTAAITRLVGLSFDHFTKCVVLPQGDFARFLHDKPRDRQDMLVRLLGLDIYERMCQSANARAAAAKNQLSLAEQRLEADLAFATAEALGDATARLKRLTKLKEQVKTALPRLREMNDKVTSQRAAADEAQESVKTLRSLAVPADMTALADALAHAQKNVAEADATLEQASRQLREAVEARGALPDETPLHVALLAHQRKAAVAADLSAAETTLAEAIGVHERAAGALEQADRDLSRAVEADAAARDVHLAQHLAGSLALGEPCPVCLQDVATLPVHPPAADLDAAKKRLADAESARNDARAELERIGKIRHEGATKTGLLSKDLAAIAGELSEYQDRAALEALVDATTRSAAAVEDARSREDETRALTRAARAALDEVREREQQARMAFIAARDRLVGVEPPAVKGHDLAEDWATLLEWATAETGRLEEKAALARQAAAGAQNDYDKLLAQLDDACAACNVELGDDDLTAAVVAAHTSARGDVERVQAALDEKKALQTQAKELRVSGEVAAQLGRHLRADGFERWIVNEALQRLVAGATGVMGELSGGQYSLTIDDGGNFLVTDHHNANETRSARTLSGGETFLASLSLALSLSDQLIELAAQGAARLDGIFLDEGFGTLDPETLDTVAATVENLASGGRMVGIVTHVRELAERVPTRFRVSKELRSSKIERIDE